MAKTWPIVTFSNKTKWSQMICSEKWMNCFSKNHKFNQYVIYSDEFYRIGASNRVHNENHV